jgi:hypothetical protein
MKSLDPRETELVGQFVVKGKQVLSDETSLRIEWLIKHVLRKLAVDSSGWETLYVDPNDGRLWEHTYPQSQMQGGGPPALLCIAEDRAKDKYDIA